MKTTCFIEAAVPICLAFVIGARGAEAQRNVPTPAERQFRAWLDGFNGTNRAAFQQFLESTFPSRDKTDDSDHFRDVTGGLDLRKKLDSTSTRFSGLVQERDSDQFLRVDLETQSAE